MAARPFKHTAHQPELDFWAGVPTWLIRFTGDDFVPGEGRVAWGFTREEAIADSGLDPGIITSCEPDE